jgi:hypothetical protein
VDYLFDDKIYFVILGIRAGQKSLIFRPYFSRKFSQHQIQFAKKQAKNSPLISRYCKNQIECKLIRNKTIFNSVYFTEIGIYSAIFPLSLKIFIFFKNDKRFDRLLFRFFMANYVQYLKRYPFLVFFKSNLQDV